MKIAFDVVEFSKWLEAQGCDCCQAFYILDGDKIIDVWESNINGVITKYRDIKLEGEFC